MGVERAALDRAGAAGLPEGLATFVGGPYTGGHILSGGQWQKLAPDRAMRAPGPLLVVLDEPTAMLASCPPGARRDIYRIGAEPGAGHRASPHTAGTVEHLILGAGRVLAGPEGDAVELGPGDYLRYPGDLPHVFDAQEPGTLGVIIMEHV